MRLQIGIDSLIGQDVGYVVTVKREKKIVNKQLTRFEEFLFRFGSLFVPVVKSGVVESTITAIIVLVNHL